MANVGKQIDHEKAQQYMAKYFKMIDKCRKDTHFATRIRFLLDDLVELRRSNWVPRTKADGPKTLKEVQHSIHTRRP